MDLITLIASSTISCADARTRNLELALEWEHRARACRVRLEACEARDALPLPPPVVVPAPAPEPRSDVLFLVAVGGSALLVGLVGGLALGSLVSR